MRIQESTNHSDIYSEMHKGLTGVIKTNIGEMPAIDYANIQALNFGFDDYDDMVSHGFYIDIKL